MELTEVSGGAFDTAIVLRDSLRKDMTMIKPRIVVTGATGKTGSVVGTELLKMGYPVRAIVHREDGRSAQLKAQGAEIAVAEMSDVERIAAALKDVQRAYYCPPIDPYMIQGAVAFAVAANAVRFRTDGIVGEVGGTFTSLQCILPSNRIRQTH